MKKAFGFELPAVSVRADLSDLHEGGGSVFEIVSYNGVSLIYKPRCLAGLVALNKILQLWSQHGYHPEIRLPRHLSFANYGWVEFVPIKPCLSLAGLRRYYRRLGSLLFLAGLLGFTDLHGDNIHADADCPVLVDAETLLTPRHSGVDVFSLLCTGMLDFGEGYSSIAHNPGGRAKLRRSVPVFNEQYVSAEAYVKDIQQGYEEAWEGFMRSSRSLEASQALVSCFGHIQTRVVLRNTNVYTTLLRHSRKLEYMRYEETPNRAWSPLMRHPIAPGKNGATKAEIRALQRGDVPLFHASPRSHDLYVQGRRIERNFFLRSGLEQLKNSLAGMSEVRLESELASIGASGGGTYPPSPRILE